jgi:hypothetical protein
MFKWIFLAQMVVYLLLIPFLRQIAEPGYYSPVGAVIVALVAFLLGILQCHFQAKSAVARPTALPAVDQMQPQPWLTFVIPALVIAYAVVVLAFGLLNRRQGSEFMAELYGQLPIYVLAILRGYEILFIPVVLLLIFGGQAPKLQKPLVGAFLLASLPFMGVVESRGRLIVLALYILCFVEPKAFIAMLAKNIKVYFAAIIVIGAFVFYSLQRSGQYYSFRDFLLVEVYQRLDGLNLVVDMQAAGLIDRIGQFDTAMFSPLVAKIPFLDAARQAKVMGRTSTKQYYVQDLLGRMQLDTSNSMITDALYFAGWGGVFVAFIALGYCIGRFDIFVKEKRAFYHIGSTAIAIAFVTSFAIIENDLMGALINFVQNAVLISLFLWIGTKRPSKNHGEAMSLNGVGAAT